MMMKHKRQQQRRQKRVRKFPPSEDLSYPNIVDRRRGSHNGTNKSNCNHTASIINNNKTTTRVPIHPVHRQGSVATINPIVSSEKQKELDLLAVSVHYLQTQFWKEVRAAGYNRKSPIYELENLSGPPGVIRQKGQNVNCPVDGKRGAAYVHCISGHDNVGRATYMLSYTWSYAIGDVIDTLAAFCASEDKDPKRTYVWICCLCINQHRVAEHSLLLEQQHISGMFATPTLDFFTLFSERVVGIGHILAMMAPWDNPSYLSRVWCIFELYTAYEKGCQTTIVMPPAETKALEKDLFGQKKGNIHRLYEVLANTRVQNAEAAVENDRVAILEIVKCHPGYNVLNARVNELLRGWVRRVITDIILKREQERTLRSQSLRYRYICCNLQQRYDLKYCNFCHDVAIMLNQNDEHDAALEILNRSRQIQETILGENHPRIAICCSIIGVVLFSKGLYEDALREHRKALPIQKFFKLHGATATSHCKIARALEAIGNFDGALCELRTALAIREEKLGGNHPETVDTHANISSVLEEMGDYDGAIEECHKALENRQAVEGQDDPDIASLYGMIGSQLFKKGRLDEALREMRKAVAIEEKILGTTNTDTAVSYNNIGLVLKAKGDYNAALVEYRKALKVFLAVHGDDHPVTARAYNNVGALLQILGYLEGALESYCKALSIKASMLPESHPDIATSHNNIGSVLCDLGKYDTALGHHRKALAIWEAIYGPDHLKLVNSYNNIGGTYQTKGDYEAALDALRKSLDITEANLGKNCPEAKEILGKIYVLLRLTA